MDHQPEFQSSIIKEGAFPILGKAPIVMSSVAKFAVLLMAIAQT
jgi:hypothetical protein